ncbi:hypothetical protein HPB47_020169 [Ixodes persulcatus]|uniref:Uncharacterized protein n=1 Tax=Ixodes persulcatus TaxID=34615 RepID=A0AC60QG35_IXOPE|nr:hypothetical protein HPB47_020169 [Ixodes persulcatus]
MRCQPQMLLLPLQGIQCRLAGVAPASDQWTLEASSALEDFGYNVDNLNKILLLRVLRKAEGHKPGSSCYEVLLFDQCGEDNVNIANELVKCGVARASELPVPDLDAEALQPPPLEEVQSCSPSTSESDNHSCEENMKEYMDQLYGHIRKELLREMESELSAAEKEAATALGEKPAPTTPANKDTQRTRNQPEASKASSASKMPPLESTLLSPSRQRQPVLWWWEDRHHVYVEVRFEGTRDYELRLSSTSFYLRFQWKGQEYATHETLHAPVLPKASNLEPRAKALRLTLVKAVASQTWNYLTDRHCRVGGQPDAN